MSIYTDRRIIGKVSLDPFVCTVKSYITEKPE